MNRLSSLRSLIPAPGKGNSTWRNALQADLHNLAKYSSGESLAVPVAWKTTICCALAYGRLRDLPCLESPEGAKRELARFFLTCMGTRINKVDDSSSSFRTTADLKRFYYIAPMHYRHVLLVDDDPEDRELFLTALSEVDASVTCQTADNGRTALEALAKGHITPDLIFVDLNMPVMSGQQFLQQVKSDVMVQHIPVIVFSTSSLPQTIEQTKALGATGFITKPDHFHELIAILRGIFDTSKGSS